MADRVGVGDYVKVEVLQKPSIEEVEAFDKCLPHEEIEKLYKGKEQEDESGT